MKLLVCDVEGTIFKADFKIDGTDFNSTMWQPIAKELGTAAIDEERETHRKWDNQEFDNKYTLWVKATFDIHKKYQLSKNTFDMLINRATYTDGVIEFFKNLDRSKYIPVLVSGGFQELIRRAQKELGINYGYGACEYIFDENTGLLADCSLTPCDFEGKYHYIESIFDIYNLDKNTDWLFVGDGKNDVHIADIAPLSFGIKPHPDLAVIVDDTVDDFYQLQEKVIEHENVIHFSSRAIIAEDKFAEFIINTDEYNKTLKRIDDLSQLEDLQRASLIKLQVEKAVLEDKLNNELQASEELCYEAAKIELELNNNKLLLEQTNNENQTLKNELNKAAKLLISSENESRKCLTKLYPGLDFSKSSIKALFQNEANNTLLRILQTLNNKQRTVEGVECEKWHEEPNRDAMEYHFSRKGRVIVFFNKGSNPNIKQIVFYHEHA